MSLQAVCPPVALFNTKANDLINAIYEHPQFERVNNFQKRLLALAEDAFDSREGDRATANDKMMITTTAQDSGLEPPTGECIVYIYIIYIINIYIYYIYCVFGIRIVWQK